MNKRDTFKVAVLEHLADSGCTLDEAKSQIKVAIAHLEKQALFENVGAMGLLGMAALPLGASYLGGQAVAGMTSPHNETAKNVKTKELIDQYRQLTQQARINAMLRQRKQGERPGFSRI